MPNLSDRDKERLRLNLLQQLHAIFPRGLSADHLLQGATYDQFNVTRDEIAYELGTMRELGLAEIAENENATQIVRWKRTGKGRNALVEANLIA